MYRAEVRLLLVRVDVVVTDENLAHVVAPSHLRAVRGRVYAHDDSSVLVDLAHLFEIAGAVCVVVPGAQLIAASTACENQ